MLKWIRASETRARCEGVRIRGRARDVGDAEEKRNGGSRNPGRTTSKEETNLEYLLVGSICSMHWLQILNNHLTVSIFFLVNPGRTP